MNTTCTFTERIEEALKGESSVQFTLESEYGQKVKAFVQNDEQKKE